MSPISKPAPPDPLKALPSSETGSVEAFTEMNTINSFVREEVLVREARALSLDRDDPVIRQHLVQKMPFLLESDADAAVPTDAELSACFEQNAERFVVAPLVSFEQLQLDPDSENAETVLAALRTGSDPGTFGGPSPLRRDIPPVSKQVVDGTFGEGFFETPRFRAATSSD